MFGYKSVSDLIFSIIAIVVSFTIHEFSHGIVSTIQGDDTPGTYGRLTLNPLAHVDLVGFITLILFGFGWAKPIPINPKRYKHPRIGVIFTSLAGPLSNLLLAFISCFVLILAMPESVAIQEFLGRLIGINAGLAVFNLIPVPPLDGSKIVGEIFGGKVSVFMFNIQRGGMFALFLLLSIPQVSGALTGVIRILINTMIRFAVIFL